jgi:NAD(P)-dependent dehydrogenase (short-subunit alcohol dehydrogenase family)
MLGIDLTGRTALVVGGSRGIGGSIVEHLCRAGAFTVFTHTGNPDRAAQVEELLAGVRREGGGARAETTDARDGAAMRALADAVAVERGSIDILVCNAGMNTARPVENETDDEWEQAMALNLDTAYYAVRAAVPHMLAREYGRIILIGSSAVFDGGGGAIDYAAAKAGMTGMKTYLSRNYAKKGILTNIVHPCVIATELLKQRYADTEAKKKLTSGIPVGRLGRPEDIAGLVAFLVSPWGDFICGQEIMADGGRTFYGK